jgi:hypothetical protein
MFKGPRGRVDKGLVDPFTQLARVADEIKRAIDSDDFAETIGDLRRRLDLAFACVLDAEEDPEQRSEFVAGFCTLTRSLDELEGLYA